MLAVLRPSSGIREWKGQFSKEFRFKDVISKGCQKKRIRGVETTSVTAASDYRRAW